MGKFLLGVGHSLMRTFDLGVGCRWIGGIFTRSGTFVDGGYLYLEWDTGGWGHF